MKINVNKNKYHKNQHDIKPKNRDKNKSSKYQ